MAVELCLAKHPPHVPHLVKGRGRLSLGLGLGLGLGRRARTRARAIGFGLRAKPSPKSLTSAISGREMTLPTPGGWTAGCKGGVQPP